MKTYLLFIPIFLLSVFCYGSAEKAPIEETQALSEEEKYQRWALELWQSLDRQTGAIQIEKAHATLNVPEDFYYLNPKDAEKVLVDVWGNPPGSNTLGMLFPANMTPFDQGSWAVTIEFDADGYVSDDDADSIDYSEMLSQMKNDTELASRQRIEQGYEGIELVGWASAPYYDQNTKKLHWAKEIKFGTQEVNTLNYNIRILGRKGVLVLNFIAGMDQQPLIESKLDTVLALAEFNQGYTYADFNPEIDEVAAYGLGALVAGKVIAKTGAFAVILMLLKKFGVFILIGIGVLFKSLFSRKQEAQ